MPAHRITIAAAVASVLLALLACSRAATGHHEMAQPGWVLITAEQIERSGGHTAWEVLQREAPMLTLREDRNGRPARMGRRGRSTIYLDEAPVIVLDGVKIGDWRSLDQIPADAIFSIRILTGIEGTTYYGTDAVSGVILIRTKGSPES
jgi:outer membrane cobalamin receptor